MWLVVSCSTCIFFFFLYVSEVGHYRGEQRQKREREGDRLAIYNMYSGTGTESWRKMMGGQRYSKKISYMTSESTSAMARRFLFQQHYPIRQEEEASWAGLHIHILLFLLLTYFLGQHTGPISQRPFILLDVYRHQSTRTLRAIEEQLRALVDGSERSIQGVGASYTI